MICVHDFTCREVSAKVGVMEFGLNHTSNYHKFLTVNTYLSLQFYLQPCRCKHYKLDISIGNHLSHLFYVEKSLWAKSVFKSVYKTGLKVKYVVNKKIHFLCWQLSLIHC